jgi:hypothetical protein
MNEGERAGWWAVAYLSMVLFATWFTIICIAVWHVKEWFL